jgi:signal transduction histidine kinase
MRRVASARHAERLLVQEDLIGRDEWQRFAPIWHAVMAGLAVLTGVLIAGDDGTGTGQRYLALGLTAALAGWYAIVGGRGLRRGLGRAGPVYLAVAAPLTIGLFVAAPVGALMLFALYPHIWVMLSPRRAIVATAAVVAAVAAVLLWRAPADDPVPAGVFVVAGVSLATALLLGLWIERIIGQSRRRAALLAELAATRAELAAVSREAGVLAERERLAREIHDTLAQGFTSVLLLLEAIGAELGADPDAARRHLDRARDTARENLAEARALVAALTPPDLTRTSLPEALRRLVERADAEPGLTAVLAVDGTPRGLPAEHEVALLRAGQEALANVRRHAGASRVEVTLEYLADRVSLRVRDDGCGFDPAVPGPVDGYGLAGMRARASRIGGAVHIAAAPGAGVALCVEIPAGDR